MKHMKCTRKILSFLLTLALVLGMSMTVFADGDDELTPAGTGDFTITLNGVANADHEYTAYQIFKGDLLEQDGKKTLSNIEWGDNMTDPAGFVKALVNSGKFSGLTEDSTAAQVAVALNGVANDAELAKLFADLAGDRDDAGSLRYLGGAASSTAGTTPVEGADGKFTYTISNLKAGYYLVQDSGDNPASDDANTRNILEVVADVDATVKSETPTVDKKILEGDQKVDANTAGVGKVVSYEITGTVPEYSGYDTYFYVISDTLSNGLTFNNDITVTVGGEEVSVVVDPTAVDGVMPEADVYVYTGDNAAPNTFRLAFGNIKDFAPGSAIVVHYSATVNANAVIGEAGNPNKVTLIYSNNPNHNYDGEEDTNRPGLPDSEKNPPVGETPEDITITYVAKIEILKTEGDGATPLPGATFTLTGTSYQTVVTEKEYFEIDPSGEYYLLKDGTYTTQAPQTAPEMKESGSSTAGYVKLADDASEEAKAADGVVKVGDAYYRPYNPAEDSNAGTLYTLVEPNDELYVSAIVTYAKKTATQIEKLATKVHMVATSGEDGKVIFEGLGAGEYTISETGVPAGYNKADDVKLVISCKVPETVTDEKQEAEWSIGVNSSEAFQLGEDLTLGVYAATIVNNKGSVLPSTGGIGTTIFYVAGGFLVLAAVVLLVAKKRMSGAER
ncbi:MAG: isopeptide-forming domain-containing fimbrial protein [Lachnospiraceae bacterium]|nr:isopeptide-forming domain-containing fimbrial protein [Lachnospiraceae bacterium]